MREVWFTSDTHFHHANIIKYCARPFKTMEEMDEAMIMNWNARVKPGHEVYHLGDFALKCDQREVENLVRRLNGQIHLIQGNHDHKQTRKAKGFAEIMPYKEIKVGDQRIVACHYAFRVWNGHHRGSWNLHGHSHGTLERTSNRRQMDVGVDPNAFRPLSFDEIKVEMDRCTFEPVDHHGNRL